MKDDCEKCGQEFQPWDKQYLLEKLRDATQQQKVDHWTLCFLCACEVLKEQLKTLGVNLWDRPFIYIYRLMFPNEVSSFYVHVLQKALTELYLEKWDEKPDVRTARFFL